SATAQHLWSVGARWPLYASASGRALLLNHSDEEVRGILQGVALLGFTETTPRSVEEFVSDLRADRGKSVVFGRGETHIGVETIAAPIRGVFEDVVAAIGVSFEDGGCGPEVR